MLRNIVEMSQSPPAYELKELPNGMMRLAFYTDAEQLEAAEGEGERWRAVEWAMRPIPSTPGLAERVEADIASWRTATQLAARAQAAAEIRAERQRRLLEVDYTLATDYPASDAEREGWRLYRQALRDIPEQEGFPWTVEWPDKPEREKAPDTILGALDVMIGGE